MIVSIIMVMVAVSGLCLIIAVLDSSLEKTRRKLAKAERQRADAESRIDAYRNHAQRCVDERNDAVNAMRMMAKEQQWRAIVAKLNGAFGWHVPGGSA